MLQWKHTLFPIVSIALLCVCRYNRMDMSTKKETVNFDPSFHMKEALGEAEKAKNRKEVPVGAVVVFEDKIVGRGYNSSIGQKDPSAHAEIVAIRSACKALGNYRLPGCDLYVTLEPCAMCLGAAVQARIQRVFFGAADPKSGAVFSVMSFPFNSLNHKIEIKGGILDRESAIILKTFFRNRR
jgi:tRNA(adenine34) deaminase